MVVVVLLLIIFLSFHFMQPAEDILEWKLPEGRREEEVEGGIEIKLS